MRVMGRRIQETSVAKRGLRHGATGVPARRLVGRRVPQHPVPQAGLASERLDLLHEMSQAHRVRYFKFTPADVPAPMD
jgi:hypothetical protein